MVREDVFIEKGAEHHGAHEDGEDEAEGEVWFVRMVEMDEWEGGGGTVC